MRSFVVPLPRRTTYARVERKTGSSAAVPIQVLFEAAFKLLQDQTHRSPTAQMPLQAFFAPSRIAA
jgi:hypothetical protein